MSKQELLRSVLTTCVSVCALAVQSCTCSKQEKSAEEQPQQRPEPAASTPPVTKAPGPSCEERIRRVSAQTGLPGAPQLESARTQILMRAKGEPLVFLRVPKASEHPRHGEWARQLHTTRYAYDMVSMLIGKFAASPATLREIVLREGYVYADTPWLAIALTELLRAEQLFSEQEFWVQRGASTLHAVRTPKGKYIWKDGPEPGRPVRINLFDRLGSEPATEPLHVDFRGLRYRLHFDVARVEHMTASHLVADLRYGKRSVKSLLQRDGTKLELECEIVPSEALGEFRSMREQRARREHLLQALRTAILAQIDEALPFDEPKTEEGQQDGHLRPTWYNAYLQGRKSYEFGPDTYQVFDSEGRPLLPQVCTDFLVDTFERASGTYYRRRGEPPARIVGKLNLEDAGNLRSITTFVAFAESHPDWFEVVPLGAEQHVQFSREEVLRKYLLSETADFRPGDLLVIRGWTPWDTEEMHYHSFFVYDADPISGLPLLLAGNPGRPSLRVWYTEMLRTPERSIRVHVRPKTEWLSSIIPESAARAAAPPPIVGGPL